MDQMETNNLFNQDLQAPGIDTRKIKKISIQNFRNIEFKEYVLNGNNILLQGENGVGKTNVLEAVYWALTGYIFNGNGKPEKQGLKPNDSAKDVVISVKIEFEYNSFTFERKQRDTYSRDGKTFKGAETTLVINGANEKNQRTAMSRLTDYLGLETIDNVFKKEPTLSKVNLYELLYNTNFLKNGMDYKEFRAIIIDMVGEVDFKDIMNENKEKYHSLFEPLKEHGLDLAALKTSTHSKIFDKEHGMNKQIENSTARIQGFDEKSKQVVDQDKLAQAKVDLENLNAKIGGLNDEIDLDNVDLIEKFNKDIKIKDGEIAQKELILRNEHQAKIDKQGQSQNKVSLNEKKDSVAELRMNRIKLNEKIQLEESNKRNINSTLTDKKVALQKNVNEFSDLKIERKTLLNPENKEIYTCPKCGEQFDICETKEYRAKIEPRLAEIQTRGEALINEKSGLEEGIETLEANVDVIDKAILELQNEREQLDKNIKLTDESIETLKELVSTELKIIPNIDLIIQEDETIKNLRDEKAKLLEKKQSIINNNKEHFDNINAQIKDLESQKGELELILNQETLIKGYKKDADEERENKENLQKLLQTYESRYELIKELEKETYEKLDEKVQGKFGENVKFKLWKQNLDGTYDTRLCDVLVKDIHGKFVNIKTINTGMYPIRAVEILNKIKKHYGIKKSFVFVDELGSLDDNHKKMLLDFQEQVFATQVGTTKAIEEKRL